MADHMGAGLVVVALTAACVLFRRVAKDRKEYITGGESVLVQLDGVEVSAECTCAKQPGGPFLVTMGVSPAGAKSSQWGSIHKQETHEVRIGARKVIQLADVRLHGDVPRSYELSFFAQDSAGVLVKLARVA